MVALLAGALCEQPNLLPPNTTTHALDQLAQDYPGARRASVMMAGMPAASAATNTTQLEVPAQATAVVAFSSGSTGKPKATSKSWLSLVGVAQRLVSVLELEGRGAAICATVPAQHSYGLETTVLTALAADCCIHSGKPFYPGDVAQALDQLQAPRLLVSTPLHLRVILNSGVSLPPLAGVVSATAPLEADLARALEQAWACPVQEIYGSTETGALASRMTTQSANWTLFPGIRFGDPARPELDSDHLPAGLQLEDTVRMHSSTSFELLGRPQNMLKVGGKRYSTDALQAQLLQLAGVSDAAVWVPDGAARPAALVVCSGTTPAQIRSQLAARVDAVFLPRPLKQVEQIPRGATGKASAAELQRLLRS